MKFLIDENLPKRIRFFNSPQFIHVLDLEFGGLDDEKIWQYALENHLIILTKDVDFQNRWLTSNQRAKVVYFDLGNLLFADWYRYLEKIGQSSNGK